MRDAAINLAERCADQRARTARWQHDRRRGFGADAANRAKRRRRVIRVLPRMC